MNIYAEWEYKLDDALVGKIKSILNSRTFRVRVITDDEYEQIIKLKEQ